ncbi:hypothetical protein SAMN05192574_103275 [Mucilaginibacter gossypiicola]|uniref:Uncharacterized protein n=1 Tax=Mucilaginibacter gossypiicola TaxID=551995 RepID=A0A1H8GTQ7_9SPHI|nr:hypothetical protein SAMN05192574_103275 [Mucilaginibacter gossypiicola]
MQFFISTFLIMLICIIALLQNKSYNDGIVLSRPQYKRPYLKRPQLTQCNYVPHTVAKVPDGFIIDKNESQTEVFAALLTDKLAKPSILNNQASALIKTGAAVHLNPEKNTQSEICCCFQCGINVLAPTIYISGNILTSIRINS